MIEQPLLAPAGTSVRVRRRRGDGPFLGILLVVVVVLQRIAVSPAGNEIPVIIPVLLAGLVVGLIRGRLGVDRTNATLLVILLVTALTATLALMSRGSLPSVLSLGLMIAIYLPMAFRSFGGALTTALVAKAFLCLMAVAAALSLLQFGLQYVGVPNVDWFTELIPSQFLVHGFSPNAPIFYGSELRRSNAFFFLEPSFLSLFLGVAVLVAVRTGRGPALLSLLLAGMVPTLAGNGIIVLVPGLLVTLLSPLRRNLLPLVPGLVATVIVGAATPLGARYLGRSTEAGSSGSSASFRFVQPYESLLPPSFETPFQALFGHGASSSDPYLDTRGLIDVTRPIVPKVLFEYGLLGAVGIILVLLVVFVAGLRGRLWLIGLLPAYFVINASFLQAELAFATYFWLTMLPRDDQDTTFDTLRQPRRSIPSKETPL